MGIGLLRIVLYNIYNLTINVLYVKKMVLKLKKTDIVLMEKFIGQIIYIVKIIVFSSTMIWLI